MAGLGPAPNPDRVGRTPRAFDWTLLPAAGRAGPPPELPKLRQWTAADRAHWATLWATPQSVEWERLGHVEVVARLLALRFDFHHHPMRAAALSAEMRQLEDRLGLNPRAMLQLRWRIVDDVASAPHQKAPPPARDRLRSVTPA